MKFKIKQTPTTSKKPFLLLIYHQVRSKTSRPAQLLRSFIAMVLNYGILFCFSVLTRFFQVTDLSVTNVNVIKMFLIGNCRLRDKIVIDFQYFESSIKVGLLPSKNIYIFICFNDSSSKMMKNVFYFILKALFVLKILKFLS